jgi:hypothetical protein
VGVEQREVGLARLVAGIEQNVELEAEFRALAIRGPAITLA